MPSSSNEDWPVIQVSDWLKQIVEEQHKGFGLAKLSPSRKNNDDYIESYFDSFHFQNLCEKTIKTHREDKKDKKSKGRGNKGNKQQQQQQQHQPKYFEDPDHELALFMITDGRSMPQTALCALGCFNLPRAERTHEKYLLKAHIHPQFPGWHDYDIWLSTLLDQLADLSQVGFKARDKNGTLRTYRAHLVCITDDMVDRNRLISDQYPDILRKTGCLVCGASGEVDPSTIKPSSKDSSGWDKRNSPAAPPSITSAKALSAANSAEEEEEDDDIYAPLKHSCDCQVGFFDPLPAEEGLPEPVSHWRPYARDIFDKLGSLSLSSSHPPDLSHIYNHIIPDLLHATRIKCRAVAKDSQSRGMRRLNKLIALWDSRKTPNSLMYVRRLEVMDMFVSVYILLIKEKHNFDWVFLQCVQKLMFYCSQLSGWELSSNGLVNLQGAISRTKWELYLRIKDTDPVLTKHLFGYSMHLLDHTVRWILMVGPLSDVWGQHTLRLAQETTYLVINRSSGDFKEKLLDEINRMQRERASGSASYIANGKYSLRIYAHEMTPAFVLPRIDTFCMHALRYIEDDIKTTFADITWYHAQALNHNFLEQTSVYPITSNFTDGKMHLVEVTLHSDKQTNQHFTTEYALLFGFFNADFQLADGGLQARYRAIICPQADPYNMKGFSEYTIEDKDGSPLTICQMLSISEAFTKKFRFVPSENIVREIYLYSTYDPDKYVMHCPTKRKFDTNCSLMPLPSSIGDFRFGADLPPWTWNP